MKSNPFNDVHGEGEVHEWLVPQGADPHTVALALEAALGVTLLIDAPGETPQGFVVTEVGPDGLRVVVHLYRDGCDDAQCCGRHGTALGAAPAVTPAQLAAVELALATLTPTPKKGR